MLLDSGEDAYVPKDLSPNAASTRLEALMNELCLPLAKEFGDVKQRMNVMVA